MRRPHAEEMQQQQQPIQPMVPEEVQREVEQMLRRVERLDDAALTRDFSKELGSIEAALAADTAVMTQQGGGAAGDSRLLAEISKVRADLCVKQGFASHEANACENYMRKACAGAGPMLDMPTAACNKFFLLRGASTAGSTAVGAAPAAAPSSSPATGPAPAPAGGLLFGGKIDRPMPSQGFSGKDVMHEDVKTYTGDWRLEFGPKAAHKSFHSICADYPNNEWCRLHGYYDVELRHSGATRSGSAFVLVALLLAAVWRQ